ncbi:hypothetical protein RSSM_04676 [Rhodopirellula sallentina SM41]|uniref:Uncharacterized protein n=1 Tax=Rhodopirellula sallentina SM41 TaxID=1263870 RepID=M5TY25_9BACT|nr:hypothetical protein RSSM_04676 [Rhodopirellula sallentina SM41]
MGELLLKSIVLPLIAASRFVRPVAFVRAISDRGSLFYQRSSRFSF